MKNTDKSEEVKTHEIYFLIYFFRQTIYVSLPLCFCFFM